MVHLDGFDNMGQYHTDKIRGAFHLHAWRQGLGDRHRDKSMVALKNTLTLWKDSTYNYRP